MPKKGHCPGCNENVEVIKSTDSGDVNHNKDNDAANYLLVDHFRSSRDRNECGNPCPNSGLQPDRLISTKPKHRSNFTF